MLKTRRWLRRSGFHLLKTAARLAALGGPDRVRRLGEAFGTMHYRLGRGKRLRLLQQMARVLPERAAVGALPADLREAYRINDRAILEILAAYSGALQPGQVAEMCALDGIDVLDRCLAQGRGAVLLGMHMGNGVAMAIHLAQRGYPVNVVYRESNKISPKFFARGIRRQGLVAIPARPAAAGFRRMLKALKGGEIVFILMDQASKSGGVPVRFLGKNMDMPPGPAELARRTGAPVIPVLLRGADERWRFRLGEAIRLDLARPLDQEVKILARAMEAHILAYPQWWTWHQRRWHRHPFSPPTGN
ncbi:MAG: lysophospholipid acyltransferase family protein [Wenzhouxiangella sp.]